MYKEIMEVLNEDKKIKSDEPDSKRNGPSETDAKYWKDVFKSLPEKEQKPCVEKTDMPMVEKKKRKHLTPPMNQVTNTRALLLMRHNTGFVFLQETKRIKGISANLFLLFFIRLG